MNLDLPCDAELFRMVLLYQEGLLCSLCKASELTTFVEIEVQICNECQEDIDRMRAAS